MQLVSGIAMAVCRPLAVALRTLAWEPPYECGPKETKKKKGERETKTVNIKVKISHLLGKTSGAQKRGNDMPKVIHRNMRTRIHVY